MAVACAIKNSAGGALKSAAHGRIESLFFSFDTATGCMAVRTQANADVATSEATDRGLIIEYDGTGRVIGVTTKHLDRYLDRAAIMGIERLLELADRLFSAHNDQLEAEGACNGV